MADYARVAIVTEVKTHPYADKLDILQVEGFQICSGRDLFKAGDRCILVPPDSIYKGTRIKKCKLRGIESQAMVLPMSELGMLPDIQKEFDVGDNLVGWNVSERLGITRYSPDVEFVGADQEACPHEFPRYIDIESILKGKNKYSLQEGEDVVLTEKIHGSNARYMFKEGRLWVGGRNQILKKTEGNLYWRAAEKQQLEARLTGADGIVLYGEVYGKTQKFRYGIDGDVDFRAFDAYDTRPGRTGWLSVNDFRSLCIHRQIPMVPFLYAGPWSKDLYEMRNGDSVLAPGKNVREGFVVRPIEERLDGALQRCIYKYVGEDYEAQS